MLPTQVRRVRTAIRRNYALAHMVRKVIATTEHPRAWQLALSSVLAHRGQLRERLREED